jgi:hypothetical protein
MADLFGSENKGATFSEDRKYRYSLWRIWDDKLPLVMFIGLNPSNADEDVDDPTIQSVKRISRTNGYGGFYMMNCFAFISTDPKLLMINPMSKEWNDNMLTITAAKCKDVVFAWGNFRVVRENQRDVELVEMFPNAKCIIKNQNGTPGHPLFKKGSSTLIKY